MWEKSKTTCLPEGEESVIELNENNLQKRPLKAPVMLGTLISACSVVSTFFLNDPPLGNFRGVGN